MPLKRRPLVLCCALLVHLLALACAPLAVSAGPVEDAKAGIAAEERGDNDEAIRLFTKALDSGDLSLNIRAIIFYNRGRAYGVTGQLDRAIQDFDQAIKLKPDDALAFYNRGRANKYKGQFDRAIQDYEQALRLEPDYGMAINNLADLFATCPDLKYQDGRKAVEYAQKAVRLERKARWLDTLAAAYARNGQFREAVQTQEEAIGMLKAEKDVKPERMKEYQERLTLYRAGSPYTEPVKGP